MGMPYQCLKRCGKFLVAARGSSIDTFNEEGSLLSTLNRLSAEDLKIASPVAERTPASLETQESEFTIDFVPESSPPAKRRKLSNASEGGSAPTSTKENGTKKEQNGAKKGNKRSEAVVSGLEMPAVILLAATEDGRHVIAVTGEDKSIRVFENTVDGDRKQFLKQLSQRFELSSSSSFYCANSE
jgi:tRNA (guanine-N(7)-)-methyltransferase subunit TRM82